MTTLVLACDPHVLIDMPLYCSPLIVVGLALWISTRRERRRIRALELEEADGAQAPELAGLPVGA